MTNDEQQIESQQIGSDATDSHPIATSLGAVGGGGAALGRSIAGKVGAAIGGVAGAIALFHRSNKKQAIEINNISI